jgi:hypothetical protein
MPHGADNSSSHLPSLDELITLREAAGLSGLSTSHLALLVRRGDIWGVKLGHNWLTPLRQSRSTWLAIAGRDQSPRGPDTRIRR